MLIAKDIYCFILSIAEVIELCIWFNKNIAKLRIEALIYCDFWQIILQTSSLKIVSLTMCKLFSIPQWLMLKPNKSLALDLLLSKLDIIKWVSILSVCLRILNVLLVMRAACLIVFIAQPPKYFLWLSLSPQSYENQSCW